MGKVNINEASKNKNNRKVNINEASKNKISYGKNKKILTGSNAAPMKSEVKKRKKLNKRRRNLKQKLKLLKENKLPAKDINTLVQPNNDISKKTNKKKNPTKSLKKASPKTTVVKKLDSKTTISPVSKKRTKNINKKNKAEKLKDNDESGKLSPNVIDLTPSTTTDQQNLALEQNNFSPNWEELKKIIDKKKVNKNPSKKQKINDSSNNPEPSNKIWFDDVDPLLIGGSVSEEMKKVGGKGMKKLVALDCEMVGGGLDGRDNILARVSIVNAYGQILYDKYVKPKEKVVDFRTKVSGIRRENLANAEVFETVQKEVDAIIKNRILVGHALKNDLQCLLLTHKRSFIRDTSKYKPFKMLSGKSHPSLKLLAKEILSVDIQTGEHSSVEDARCAMQLYLLHRTNWENPKKTPAKDNSEEENE